MESQAAVNARIRARRAAEDVWRLMVQAEAADADDAAAYWARIAELAVEQAIGLGRETKAPLTAAIEPMPEARAAAFERVGMPFGRDHKDRPIGEVPIEYLCRLCDPSTFLRDLRRYLASDRGRRRIETGE